MNWHDLRYILAVARTGSLAEAARRLGVDPTTVSRRIAVAERHLDTRLFERSADGLRCTPAGEAAAKRAARIETEVAALQLDLDGRSDWAWEVVRLTAPPVINRLLSPALSLAGQLPRIEFVAEPRNLSFSKREADIALRFGRPERGPAVIRRLARLDYAVYRARRATGPAPWLTYDATAHWIIWSTRAGRSTRRAAMRGSPSMTPSR